MKRSTTPAAKDETFESVWDAIADTPEQAANLRARSGLMRQVAAIVKDSGWTQAEKPRVDAGSDAAPHQ